MSDSPYEPPSSDQNDSAIQPNLIIEKPFPAVSPRGTTMPRYIAAVMDNALAIALTVILVKVLPEHLVLAQLPVAVLVYFGYFLVFEASLGVTPGKLVMGLKILSFDGGRCTITQVLIRTAFRVIEVNPLLLGALPAAIGIICTRDRQRLGDMVAGTVVVLR